MLNAKKQNIVYSGHKKRRNVCGVYMGGNVKPTGTQAIMDLHIPFSVVGASLCLFSALKHTNKQPFELLTFA